jgi:hypothetical protein
VYAFNSKYLSTHRRCNHVALALNEELLIGSASFERNHNTSTLTRRILKARDPSSCQCFQTIDSTFRRVRVVLVLFHQISEQTTIQLTPRLFKCNLLTRGRSNACRKMCHSRNRSAKEGGARKHSRARIPDNCSTGRCFNNATIFTSSKPPRGALLTRQLPHFIMLVVLLRAFYL